MRTWQPARSPSTREYAVDGAPLIMGDDMSAVTNELLARASRSIDKMKTDAFKALHEAVKEAEKETAA